MAKMATNGSKRAVSVDDFDDDDMQDPPGEAEGGSGGGGGGGEGGGGRPTPDMLKGPFKEQFMDYTQEIEWETQQMLKKLLDQQQQ